MNNIQNTKLISALRTLNTKECNQMKHFLISGPSGSNGTVVRLYEHLMKYYPQFNDSGLSKPALFNELYKDTNYDDKKMRYALSDLYGLLCKFLIYNELDNNQALSNSLLKQSLARREADKAFIELYRKDVHEEDYDAGSDVDFFFYRYRDEYTFLNHYLPRQKRTTERPLESSARNLDLFYVSRKLQLLCEAINSGNVLATHVDFFLQDEIVRKLENGHFNNVPVISIYYRILMTLMQPEEEIHFEKLNALLLNQTANFSSSDLREMYQYLMNYCIRKINLGETVFISRLFDVYQQVLNRELLLNQGVISQWDYKNIVSVSVRSGNIEWADQFVNEFKERLPDNERENAFIYNKAYLYFAKKNYKKALSTLQKVEFNDIYYQLDMRVILLKCYFETYDEDSFYYHTAAFKIFLTRNKLISAYQRKIYRNLIKYTTQIMNAAGNIKKLQQIQIEVNSVKQIADIGWLQLQIEKMLV